MSDPYMISSVFFFFNDTATTEIYTLSLHDALPILGASCLAVEIGAEWILVDAGVRVDRSADRLPDLAFLEDKRLAAIDRKSTRLNSSHANISYAVFCLKKKKSTQSTTPSPAPSTYC